MVVKLDGEREWVKSGTILGKCETPRSYLVQSETGVLRLNRRHLMPTVSGKEQPLVQKETNGQDQHVTTTPDHAPDIQEQEEQSEACLPESDSSHTTITSPHREKTRSGRAVTIPQRYRDFV